jgi:hypothetical protein
MHELTGDIWDYLGKGVIAITTNGSLTKDGRAVLGRGCARQAGARFPDLPQILGALILAHGNHVHDLGHGLVSFPVEDSAWSLPDLRLIARSASELRTLADHGKWGQIVVPRPGCGGGGLAWQDVRPLLSKVFNDRFWIVSTDEV